MNIRPGVNWQLVFFSCIALWHCGGYALRLALQSQGALPPGVQELAVPVLILELMAWGAAGTLGVVCAMVLRRWYVRARLAIGITSAAWSGLFLHSWLWQGRPYDWFPAGLYLFIAGAAIAPPLWQVTIRGGPR